MNESETILILGLNSFSGAVTASKLLEEGFNVIGVNRSREIETPYRPYFKQELNSQLKIYELGSNYSGKKIVEICDEYDIPTILNFAAQSMVGQSWKYPWDWYQTNCVWLSKLTSELIDWGKLYQFIQYTTPEVYGSTTGWISEDSKFNPSTPYAISRAAGDLHLMAEQKQNGFPVIFTRAANVYGPFQQRYRIIVKSLLSAANDDGIELHGGGLSKRSFIFMEDVADALLKIIKCGKIGDTYHISTQQLVSIRRVVEMCYQAYDRDASMYLKTIEDRPGKDQAYMLESSKIRVELGWHDKVSIQEGIMKTKIWVDEWLPELLKQPPEYIHRP